MNGQIYRLGSGGMVPVKERDLKVGQIFHLDGYGYNKRVIYEVQQDRFLYAGLSHDELGTSEKYGIRPYSEKFGIGEYYNEGELATEQEIADAVARGKAAVKKFKEASDAAAAEHAKYAAIGKALFDTYRKPEHVALIVAELESSDCDLYTDYFSSHTVQTVILAFSKHKRNLFPEMRKAALNCDIPEVRALADAPTDWEQREDYSGGAGLYLGEIRYSGWRIRKVYYYQDGYAAAAGRPGGFQIPEMKTSVPETKAILGQVQGLKLENYSEKAVALYGNTKPLRDKLTALGGKFNMRLKGGPGWIFQKSKRPEIEQLMAGG